MDDGETTEAAPEPTEADHTLAAVDAALAPAFRNASNLGTVSYSELKHALTCVRQALAHVLFPPGPPAAAEPVDVHSEQMAAQEVDRALQEQLATAASKPEADAATEADPLA